MASDNYNTKNSALDNRLGQLKAPPEAVEGLNPTVFSVQYKAPEFETKLLRKKLERLFDEA